MPFKVPNSLEKHLVSWGGLRGGGEGFFRMIVIKIVCTAQKVDNGMSFFWSGRDRNRYQPLSSVIKIFDNRYQALSRRLITLDNAQKCDTVVTFWS